MSSFFGSVFSAINSQALLQSVGFATGFTSVFSKDFFSTYPIAQILGSTAIGGIIWGITKLIEYVIPENARFVITALLSLACGIYWTQNNNTRGHGKKSAEDRIVMTWFIVFVLFSFFVSSGGILLVPLYFLAQ
jgi:hypothetical protein